MSATSGRKRERLRYNPDDAVKEMGNDSKRIKTEADSPTKSVLCPDDSSRSLKKSHSELTHKPVKKEVETDSSESDTTIDGEESEKQAPKPKKGPRKQKKPTKAQSSDDEDEQEEEVEEDEEWSPKGKKKQAPKPKKGPQKQKKPTKANRLCGIEEKRLKNLQDNAAFLSSLGIDQVKNELRPGKKMTKKEQEKEKTNKTEPVEPRQLSAPLNMEDVLFEGNIDDHNKLMDLLEHNIVNHKVNTEKKVKSISLNSFVQDFTNITLKKVARIEQQRICSVAIHPSEQVTLVVAGNDFGLVGFWNVVTESGHVSDDVVAYEPHSSSVTCIKFCPQLQHRMLSCSYDGTLKCCDIEKTVFDEIYTTPEENIPLKSFDFLSPESLIVTQGNGNIAVVDTRVKRHSSDIYTLHKSDFGSVSIHPMKKHIFVTVGDGVISTWDLRKLTAGGKKNRKLDWVGCDYTENSAYFSPLTGKYILSFKSYNGICIYDASAVTNLKEYCSTKRIPIDSGSWRKTFHPTWHPQREDVFVSGSFSSPRQIELIGIDGKHIKDFKSDDLGSVCPLNEIHPTRNILVGGSSSGKLHVFM